jgi:hypothetical protein
VDIDAMLAVPVPEWRASVHAEHRVSCDGCHGGDPRLEDADESMAEEAGFLRLPSWTEMSDHCGVCHEEIAESYTIGRFGRALGEGLRVATCATCHMQDGHRIVEASPGEIVTTASCPDCPSVADPLAVVATLERVRDSELVLSLAMDDVEAKGIELSDFRADLREVHRNFTRALHEFDSEGIDAAASLAITQCEGVGEQVAVLDREADSRLRLGSGLLGSLALLFIALVASLRNPD